MGMAVILTGTARSGAAGGLSASAGTEEQTTAARRAAVERRAVRLSSLTLMELPALRPSRRWYGGVEQLGSVMSPASSSVGYRDGLSVIAGDVTTDGERSTEER